jgi:hypothetical protein
MSEFNKIRDEIFQRIDRLGLTEQEPVKVASTTKKAAVSTQNLIAELDAFVSGHVKQADDNTLVETDGLSQEVVDSDMGESQNAEHETDGDPRDSADGEPVAGQSEGNEDALAETDGMSQEVVDNDTGESQNAAHETGEGDTEERTQAPIGVDKTAEEDDDDSDDSDDDSDEASDEDSDDDSDADDEDSDDDDSGDAEEKDSDDDSDNSDKMEELREDLGKEARVIEQALYEAYIGRKAEKVAAKAVKKLAAARKKAAASLDGNAPEAEKVAQASRFLNNLFL